MDVRSTLFSGQSFLWDILEYNGESYGSVINSIPVMIRQISVNEIEITAESNKISGRTLPDFFRHYFTLDIANNSGFPKSFPELYPEVWQLLSGYFSLKILRQDFFETMICFMCAQGIGMHLIRKQVSMLRKTYGEKRVLSLEERDIDLYSFPSPGPLAEADPVALSRCTNNNRVRAANIILAARAVTDGTLDLDALRDPLLPLAELRRMLCKNRGIGYKIADCIALFGLGRFDAFPIDTHVKQYLAKWFESSVALRSLSPATYLVLDAEARSILDPDLAGYGGHQLFHCWRKEIKRLRSF